MRGTTPPFLQNPFNPLLDFDFHYNNCTAFKINEIKEKPKPRKKKVQPRLPKPKQPIFKPKQ